MEKEKKLLDVQEAAYYLGVSTGTLRRWAQETKVGGVEVGSRGDWRFTKDELDELIKIPEKKQEKGSFPEIRHLLLTHAEEIEEKATQLHIELLGKDNLRTSVLKEYGKFHVQLLKSLARFIDANKLPTSVKIFQEIGTEFGKQAVEEGLTIEEATNGMIFVKQVIWSEINESGLLKSLKSEDFYQLSVIIGTLVDIIVSKIGYSYHEAYRKNEEALQQEFDKTYQHMRLYETVMKSTPDLMYVIDLNYQFLYANDALLNMWGIAPKQTRGKGLLGLVPKSKDAKKYEKEIDQVVATKKPIRGEISLPHAKLGKRIYDYIFTPIFNDRKKVIAIAGTTRDITDLKQKEEALRESQERYRLVVENTLDLVSLFDSEGKFIYASPAYRDVLGYSPNSLIGLSLFDVPDPNEVIRLKDIFHRILTGEKIMRFITKGIDKEGNLHVFETSGSAIFDDNDKPQLVVSVAHDITEREKQEKRKDDFIAMASHELKTPLTSAKLFTQVLERKFGKSMESDSQRLLSKMNTNLNKLDELVKSLLDVTRVQQGKLQVIQEKFLIKDLVLDIVEDLQPITDHKLILDWHTKLFVCADKDRVRQVLVNLITNAIKYSPESDKVIIGSKKRGKFIEIYVQDFGIGIPKSEHAKIFDRFYQANSHQTYPGLGLGLYISNEIIKANGGNMWVKSKEGKESTFSFTLPIYKDET